MSNDDTRTLVLRYLKVELAAARSGDFTAIDELVAGDVEFHDPGLTAMLSRSSHQQRWQALVAAFTEMAFNVHDLISAGDRVVARWSMRGIHGGPFAGIEPTGQEIALAGITIYRIDGSRIAEAWSCYDERGLLEQLGVGFDDEADEFEEFGPEPGLGMIV